MSVAPALDAAALDSGAPAMPGVRGRWIGLAILSFVYMLNFMDRQILSVLIEPIKRDIHVNDTDMGLLTGTLFAIFYSVITIPIAMLADRASRVRIVAAGCFLWSIFTGLSGFATSLLHLAVARVGLAFGEAGGVAPSLSILSDIFPPRRRVVAMAMFMSASPFGVLIGTMGGGFIAAAWGWRATFKAAALIGLVTVPILLLLVREPERGRFEQRRADAPRTSLIDTVRLYFKLPSLSWLALAAGLFAVIGNGLLTWMPAVLMRGYGASVREVALYYGPLVGLGLVTGTWTSGALVNRLSARSMRWYALVPAIAILLCAPLFALALMSGSWGVALAWLFVPIALINFGIAPTMTVVQNLAPPDARSTASALLMLVLNFVGIGLGPLIVGAASDALRPTMGTDSLRYGMLATLVPVMVLCGVAFLLASRSIERDHDRVASGEVHG